MLGDAAALCLSLCSLRCGSGGGVERGVERASRWMDEWHARVRLGHVRLHAVDFHRGVYEGWLGSLTLGGPSAALDAPADMLSASLVVALTNTAQELLTGVMVLLRSCERGRFFGQGCTLLAAFFASTAVLCPVCVRCTAQLSVVRSCCSCSARRSLLACWCHLFRHRALLRSSLAAWKHNSTRLDSMRCDRSVHRLTPPVKSAIQSDAQVAEEPLTVGDSKLTRPALHLPSIAQTPSHRTIPHPPHPPPLAMSTTRPAGAEDDSGEWEQQTTRKQRKAAAAKSAAAAPPPAADSDSSFPLADAPQAASSSTFPIADDAGLEAAMESDFMDAGHIGLDGQVMPRATQTAAPAVAAPAAAAAPAPAAASSSSGVTTSQGGAAGRRPRYQFDETQLPKCFVCQTRHDIGECRRKEKL